MPVDDDPATRDIVTMILQTLGYPVMEAASATEAIALAERHTGEFHLLIIDVIMP
ncbi:response regulator [Syntrophotalea acetylenivorans]|uniref:response regulator n=1 Tax=Syntrophotalea acetylenivorans TaxID=1842532 RepID=UPI002110BBB9|nr:response regulator [Syntrophotalea acetylenivorans]